MNLRTRPGAERRRPRLGGEGEQDSWLVTYSDVITLLLAFFVMIMSVSDLNQGKIEALKEGLAEAISNTKVQTPLRDIEAGWQSVIETRDLEQFANVTIDDKGVLLEFTNFPLYDSGSADIQPQALPLLNDVAKVVSNNLQGYYIVEIEGHTDDVPIHNEKYDSNWELSSNRATNIVKYFQEQGLDPMQMKASGYADSRPKVTDETIPVEERRTQNRRILIRVRRD